MTSAVAHYYVEDDPPEWWASIDPEAAQAERWPNPVMLRKTERPQLGSLAETPHIPHLTARRVRSDQRDADAFIAHMEARKAQQEHDARTAAVREQRAARRREEWLTRMKEKGVPVVD